MNQLMSNFTNFMNTMKGKNPNEVLQNMMATGQINQQQLNQAQQMANQMQGTFNSMRGMFGFKK